MHAAASTLPPTPTPPITPGPGTCTDFDLQLGNAAFSETGDLRTGIRHTAVSGNVEICFGGSFYSICDEGWGQEEAQVACNALNYPTGEYRKFIQYTCKVQDPQINTYNYCVQEQYLSAD